MKLAFIYPTNRTKLVREVKNGLSPDNALYGLNHMHKFGFQVSSVDVYPTAEKILDIIFTPLHTLFRSQIDIDFKLGRALLSARQLNLADAIVTNIDGVGLAVCFLKRLKIVKPPVIYAVGLFYIQGKLTKAIDSGRETLFLRFYRWILKGADHLIYHSPIEKTKLMRLGLYNSASCTFVPMGSDSQFFKPTTYKNKFLKNLVIAVGKDSARDYPTFLKAAQKLPSVQFLIVCHPTNTQGLEPPPNVRLLFDIPYRRLANLYRQAAIVAIPIVEMNRSSGQMTLTDAIQAHKPIIISDVVGISHYPLTNNQRVIKVKPVQVKELTFAIHKLLSSSKLQKKLVKNSRELRRRFTTENYADDLSRVITWTVDKVRLLPLSSKDLEFARKVRNQNREYFLNSSHISKKTHQKWFENYQKTENDYMYLLAANEEKIGIGAIYNINDREKSAEIGRFAIDSKFKNQGFGKILLRKIEYIASKLNLKELHLEVLKTNRVAINLYRKLGFKISAKRRSKGKRLVIMIKSY